MTPAASAPSHMRLAPDIQSMPARIPAKTSEVPRSGWSMTSANGGPTSTQAPRIARSESSFAWRLARYWASTMIIRILASSLNWNVNGPNVIQRADPPTPSPIASVSASRPSCSA